MRLVITLFLWIAVPFYWLALIGIRFTDSKDAANLPTAIVLTLIALGMGYGELVRAARSERRSRQ